MGIYPAQRRRTFEYPTYPHNPQTDNVTPYRLLTTRLRKTSGAKKPCRAIDQGGGSGCGGGTGAKRQSGGRMFPHPAAALLGLFDLWKKQGYFDEDISLYSCRHNEIAMRDNCQIRQARFRDVPHATTLAFKNIKIGQVVKSNCYSSEPHDLRAA